LLTEKALPGTLLIVFVSPALVRRICLHLEENEGLHVEEHAGPVP
jgi:hypothetical protein